MTKHSCQLYLIAPPDLDRAPALEPFVQSLPALLETGLLACLMLPTREADERGIQRAALQLSNLCKTANVAFLVEDRIGLALESDADGVHLSEPPKSVSGLRAHIGPGAIVGVFCGTSRHLGLQAAEQSADYVAFGATSPEETDLDGGESLESIVAWWQEMMTPPVVAMVGEDPDHIPDLARAGADFVAIGEPLWRTAGDPKAALSDLAGLLMTEDR